MGLTIFFVNPKFQFNVAKPMLINGIIVELDTPMVADLEQCIIDRD